MSITILAFAQARDVVGFSSREISCHPDETPRMVYLRIVGEAVPGHYRVALDCEYTTWDAPVGQARELAILPPVSGG